MKTIKTISLIFILLSLTMISCDQNKSELERLITENELLKNKLDSVQRINDRLIYKPVFEVKSTKIKLGEEYLASVNLVEIDTLNLPTVVICDSVGYDNIYNITDTLQFDSQFDTFIYRNKPTEKGRHSWEGAIFYKRNNGLEKVLFVSTYDVE